MEGLLTSIICIPLLPSATKAVLPSGESVTPHALPEVSTEERKEGTCNMLP